MLLGLVVDAAEHALGAGRHYLLAWVASHEAAFDISDPESDAWNAFRVISGREGATLPPRALEPALAVLAGQTIVDLDETRDGEVGDVVERLLPLLDWFQRRIELRSILDVRAARWRRHLFVAGLFLSLAVGTAAFVSVPKNVALRRPTTMSSTHPSSTAPEGGVVDGITDESYGAHTTAEETPWIMVDLVTPRRLKKVKIYNRGDGWFDTCLPLTLEVSEDAQRFTEVEVRTTVFSQADPWQARLNGKAVRFVRVRGKSGGYVALSEIEAYER